MKGEKMELTQIGIEEITKNPENPRIIRDEKFKSLVKSVRDFPEMLNVRPVVVNEALMILGGNMRYEAAKTAGFKSIPCIIAKGFTTEQQKQFVIKDNVSAGDWDWESLANDWNDADLDTWGLGTVSNYDPVLDPKSDTSDVTSAEVEKRAKELAGEMIRDQRLQGITCPECGNEFSIEAGVDEA